MGREVKRVPMDFDWPLKTIWKGYLDPTGQYGDDWERTEPPEGPAYQMWETTSAGSPISPPCATQEELVRWLADNNASASGSHTATYEQWLEMVKGPGWAPVLVFGGGGLRSGVEFAAEEK